MYAGKLVEAGATDEIFYDTRHRYTEALLRSIPRLNTSREAPLFSIPGQPPDLTRPPQGCRFAARCGHAEADCLAGTPPLVGAEHSHACLHPAQGAA
jgi:oligopeptide/dipeptide ABC transporter ATP-binding protein